MHTHLLLALLVLVVSGPVSDAVKIGISKPATENTTTEAVESTTHETTTTLSTTVSTTTSSSTTQKPTTKPVKTTTTTTTTSSTTTTTPLPPTTTTTSPTSKNNTQLSTIRNRNIDYAGYYCSCDLRHNYCDINCCCDIDCIAEELNSFDCHREESDLHLETVNYQQGLPPCKINQGWLCVIRNNFDDTKRKKLHYVLDIVYHDWPELILETNEQSKDRSFYKIGEPILLYSLEANEIVEYDIPFSLVGQECQIVESIRHLTSQKTSCHTTIEKVQILETTLFQKLETSFLLQKPNSQIPMDDSNKETQFIPITLFRCTDDFDCVSASINNSYYEDSDYSALIQTKIYHNITNLLSCEVFFFRADSKSDRVWQHYEISFIHINETDGVAVNVSGPLGYNTGSPIIVGHKVLLNESADHTDSNLILNYFHPNRTEGFHIHVPIRRHGRCKESQATVNFGESILIQCSVQLDNSTDLNSDTNFTRICGVLQERSLQFLQASDILSPQDDYFISIFGYPVNKTDDWLKLEVLNYEHVPVVGSYLDKEYAFICQNMILGLKYQFLTVKDDVQGVKHQSIIKRATIHVGRRHDLQFQLDEVISIPITISVIFQDLREISNTAATSSYCVTLLLSVSVVIFYLKQNSLVVYL